MVSNTTFFNNKTKFNGGGIHINAGTLHVHNSTFFDNYAEDKGGSINNENASVYIANTIIANSIQRGNCYGSISKWSTHNLATDGSCSPGFTQVKPQKLALGLMKGSPAYFPLKPGSVAIDKGTNNDCPATDQRGVLRPQDGDGKSPAICDIGSYEAIFGELIHDLFLPLIRQRIFQ